MVFERVEHDPIGIERILPRMASSGPKYRSCYAMNDLFLLSGCSNVVALRVVVLKKAIQCDLGGD